MYRNILFDLDNTIMDFDRAEETAFGAVMSGLGLEPSKELTELYSRINLSCWKLLELGQLTLAETKVNRYRLLFEKLGIDASPEEATAKYEGLLAGCAYVTEGAKELLEALFAKYRLYIATNGTASVQHSRLKAAGLTKYFDDIFISQELGFKKPDREFFDCCFERIPDFDEKETIIVGDSLTSDIKGGRGAGIATVWYNPKRQENDGSVVPTYEITRLEDIKDILSAAAKKE